MQRQKTVFQIFLDPHMLVVGYFGSRQISLLLSSSIHPVVLTTSTFSRTWQCLETT